MYDVYVFIQLLNVFLSFRLTPTSCFVPLVPIHSANIWVCATCHWEVDRKPGGPEPARAGYPGAQGQADHPQSGEPQYNN